MTSGIIVTHGGLAEALRDAAAAIAGDSTSLEIVSNDGLSPDELVARVRDALRRAGPGGAIVFTDLGGGSCANACRAILREHADVRLVTGINLPMLVDFVLRRGDLDLDALVERLLRRGQASIQELRGG
jgi:mannose/fructose-specific phosphotransferase system component IIA